MQTLQDNWTELAGRVRAFVGRRVSDSHAADDIAQEVMLKLQQQLDALPPEDRLPAWIFTVARNAITDHYRARALRGHVNLEDVDPASADDPDSRDDALRELAPCLLRMIEHLPEPYREALKLVDFEQLSQQELADRMGVSLTAAKSRIRRARQQMREMIEDCCRLDRNSRGNVVDYETTERSSRYCGDADGEPQCDR